jgi:hypothetical protein
VVEDTVEDQPDVAPRGLPLELPPMVEVTEVRVDPRVVLRVVAVVRPGVEDRVEVDRRDA